MIAAGNLRRAKPPYGRQTAELEKQRRCLAFKIKLRTEGEISA